MNQSKWIWYPGDFEIYHSNLVHSRREDFGIEYPVFWMQSTPCPRVDFYKNAALSTSRKLTVHSTSYGMVLLDNTRFALNTPFSVCAGQHTLTVRLSAPGGLCSIFIDDADFGTDESWLVSDGSFGNMQPAEHEELFAHAAATPAYEVAETPPVKFPFSYENIYPVSMQEISGGRLYDFGRESYGPIQLTGVAAEDEVFLCYGESREEALDFERAFLRQTVTGSREYAFASRAFRYLFLRAPKSPNCTLTAQYEFLPLQDIADFSCDDPLVEKIWDTCAYTFHLNSREFYQDGIKRDRWVWAGDSYQSFLINSYLYFDSEITKRTIRALLGRPPYKQHINTINDYTLYLLIAVEDYYRTTGDEAFVKEVYPNLDELFTFVQNRLDENGMMVLCHGDWIFIDWSPMDKDGPLCAEQILLWRATRAMAVLGTLCTGSDAGRTAKAEALRSLILQRYWFREKHAFIDSFTSGKKNVTRHANIFAILYDFVEVAQQRELLSHVLDNDDITQITTPYFKFFELCARCKMGDLKTAQHLLTSYWGGMLKDGATTIWEQYDPTASGTEHYAMYGDAYGCSLCHAWGSGPIYLLGRWCLGVQATDIAYRSFRVHPQAGIYHELHGVVPLPKGTVRVDYTSGVLRVLASCPGGTLEAGGNSYPLEAGKLLEVHCTL